MAAKRTNRLFYVTILVLYKILFFSVVHFVELKFGGNVTEFPENQTTPVVEHSIPIVHKDSNIKSDEIPISWESKSIIDRNSNTQRLSNAASKDTSSSLNQRLIHKEKVKFLNPAIEFLSVPKRKSDTINKIKNIGLFAKNDITFGSVLCTEYPIINVPELKVQDISFKNLPYFDGVIKKYYKKDPEFKRIWMDFAVDSRYKKWLMELLKSRNKSYPQSVIDNFARFVYFRIPAHEISIAYSVIGRVRFHLPSNAMIVVRERAKGSGYKAALIATRAIQKGEEIVVDVFADWWQTFDVRSLSERKVLCKDRGFDLNEKWMSLIKKLEDESPLSLKEKENLMMELYPNGMIGKNPDETFHSIKGCEGMDSNDCNKKMELTKAIESGSIFDETSYHQIDHNEKGDTLNVNAFHYDTASINTHPLMTHPIWTKFLHSALTLKHFGDDKGYGVITTKKVPFGSVLAVEYPMLRIKETVHLKAPSNADTLSDVAIESMMRLIDRDIEEQIKRDRHFDRIWKEEITANKELFNSWYEWVYYQKKKIPMERLMNWAKFNTFWFGSFTGHKPIAIYSILSRINHGIPQNVAAIFGDKKDDFVFVLLATRDLKEGEEVFLNYLQGHDAGQSGASQWIQQNRVPEYEWIWTEDLKEIMKNTERRKTFTMNEGKQFLHDRMYSNGIMGKQSGRKLQIIDGTCGDWMTKQECKTAKAIDRDIDTGKLFRIIREHTSASEWMGKEFAASSSRNLCHTPT